MSLGYHPKSEKGRWGNWVFPQSGSIETARFQGAERSEPKGRALERSERKRSDDFG